MKILIVGDMHCREKLGYSDYFADRRNSEKKTVFEQITRIAEKCSSIVFLGDQLNGRNNPSEVIREFVEFVERS